MNYVVLSDRECGTVAEGGLYATGIPELGGKLLPFTAIAAPFDAEVANPRRAQAVAIGRTLEGTWGLWYPSGDEEPYKGVPGVGMADLWGQIHYKTVWSAIDETSRMGPCRRIAHVPENVKPPYPLLMLHKQAHFQFGVGADAVETWLFDNLAEPESPELPWAFHSDTAGPEGDFYGAFDWAFLDADELGRVGCDDFMWHPHVALWQLVPKLKEKRLYTKFLRDCEVETAEGVCGLTWVTHHFQVLREGQDEVDPKLKAKGVMPALSEHDPRATGL